MVFQHKQYPRTVPQEGSITEETRKKSEKGKGGKTNKANMPKYSKHPIFLLINSISFISFEYIEQKYIYTHTSSIRTPNLSSKLKT